MTICVGKLHTHTRTHLGELNPLCLTINRLPVLPFPSELVFHQTPPMCACDLPFPQRLCSNLPIADYTPQGALGAIPNPFSML